MIYRSQISPLPLLVSKPKHHNYSSHHIDLPRLLSVAAAGHTKNAASDDWKPSRTFRTLKRHKYSPLYERTVRGKIVFERVCCVFGWRVRCYAAQRVRARIEMSSFSYESVPDKHTHTTDIHISIRTPCIHIKNPAVVSCSPML